MTGRERFSDTYYLKDGLYFIYTDCFQFRNYNTEATRIDLNPTED